MLTVSALVVAMVCATLLGVVAIRNLGNSSAEQTLMLLCQTGEKNLDSYFGSVEQSVKMVSSYVSSDLDEIERLDHETLVTHLDHARRIFGEMAKQTLGVLTYYYRIDPSVSTQDTGFWYTNLNGRGFEGHTPTDLTLYDTNDTSQLVWFTVPKATGEGIWLPPYITDNLDVRVISYNEPVVWNDQFIGVLGIELDYSKMAEQVNNIKLYDNGYAFVCDSKGQLVYHPHIDVTTLPKEELPEVPAGLLGDGSFCTYEFEGVRKKAVSLPLNNGAYLVVTVPIAEINAGLNQLIVNVIILSLVLLLAAIAVTARFTKQITKPLHELTVAAEQVNDGNYEIELSYDKDDEIGLLTKAFNKLTSHLKNYIEDLNSLAYADALTSVHNKGAFDISLRELQTEAEEAGQPIEYGVVIFDCNGLKEINDRHGHDKGDIYLRTACTLICEVFEHSPVFRIGGDEFSVILRDSDYRRRDALAERFRSKSAEVTAAATQPWEEVHVAMGIATYNPQDDRDPDEVVRRADKNMYDNKRAWKEAQKQREQEAAD